MNSPSYLWLSRHHIYYFRAKIPVQYLDTLGQKEYRVSLKTRCLQTARRSALVLWLIHDEIFKYFGELMSYKITLDHYRVDHLILFTFKQLLGFFREEKMAEEDYKNENIIKETKEFSEYIEKHQALNTDFPPDYILHPDNFIPYEILGEGSDLLALEKLKVTIVEISKFFVNMDILRFGGQISEMENSIDLEFKKFMLRSAKSKEIENYQTGINARQNTQVPDELTVKTFREVSESYLDSLVNKKGKDAVKPSTIDTYGRQLEMYEKLLGNKKFHSITKNDIVNLIDLTWNIPTNCNKINFTDTHDDLISLIHDKNHDYKTLAPPTVSNYFLRLQAVCDHALKRNNCHKDPAAMADFFYTKKPQVERLSFDKKDLIKLFSGHVYQEQKLARLKHSPFHFWLPLIGAFTGARLNEMCSLYVKDILWDKENRTWYFDITDTEADQTLKTENSKRKVPIHQQLIKCGFLDYIEEQKKKGKERLFSEGLAYSEDAGWGARASSWFNRIDKKKNGGYSLGYAGRCGVKKPGDPSEKVFHSFRHSFIHNLKNNVDITIDRVGDLCGHEKGIIQTQDYGGKQYTLPIKLQTMGYLNYDIDLSHIHWKKFKKKL